jgi:type I restriction enzyme S subunit
MSQFKPYPAYKDSGVEWLGEVPEHWVLTPIKHLALLNPRKSEFYGDPEQLCSFVPMEKLKTGCVLLDEERPINEVIGGYTYFEDGDVLQAKVTPCFENKNVAIAKGLTNGIGFGSTEISVLRPYDSIISGFLYYRVQEDSYMSFCTSSMIGAGGLKRVPTDVINNFKVAAPALPEQTQIARFLDHETARIDALIEEQQRLIELLKEKRQAVISHAVTKGLDPTVPMKDSGVEWLGEVPAHWELKQLKHVVDPTTSITYGIVQAGPEFEGGIPYIRTSDMSGDSLPTSGYPLTSPDIDASYARSRVRPGDIVISIRASVGKCLPVPGGLKVANLTQGTAKISAGTEITRDFLLAFLNASPAQSYFDLMAKGATFKEITLDALRRVPVLLPPKNEQVEIDQFVTKHSGLLEETCKQAIQSISLLQERRSALISAAVTGKIDLRGWQPPANTPVPLREQETV